jgi:hypothetical protein
MIRQYSIRNIWQVLADYEFYTKNQYNVQQVFQLWILCLQISTSSFIAYY